MTTRCNLSIQEPSGVCYYMNFVVTKKLHGVACMKVGNKKLCPYHPKYKEYRNVDTNERVLDK